MENICDLCGEECEDGEWYECEGCGCIMCPECVGSIEDMLCFECVEV